MLPSAGETSEATASDPSLDSTAIGPERGPGMENARRKEYAWRAMTSVSSSPIGCLAGLAAAMFA
jgi:hypothetical protein